MINSSEDNIMVKNSSWWSRRTNLEKNLVIAVVLLIVTAISVLSVHLVSLRKTHKSVEEEDVPSNLCETASCIHASANFFNYMDQSIDPCDDFYQFACGRFLKEAEIPDDKNSVDSSQEIRDASPKQLRTLIEESSSPKEAKPFKLYKRFYSACMNTTAIETDKYDTLFNSVIDVLGGWPVLEGEHWNGDAFDWKNFTYTSRRLGLQTYSFLNIFPLTDVKNSSKRIIGLDEPWLELSREQFLKGFDDELVQSYYEYMVNLVVAISMDEGSREFAEKEMDKVLKFEVELAKISLKQEEKRDVTKLYNPMTVGELQLKYLDIPWLEYLNNVINLTHSKVTENDMVDVTNPDYIKKFIRLITRTPKRTQGNYAMLKIVRSLVPYLTEDLRNLDEEYDQKMFGTRASKPRWHRCLNNAGSMFGHVDSALYIRKYFTNDIKIDAEEMTLDIYSKINETLEQAAWMDEDTRGKALEKAGTMSFYVAYADELLDDKNLENYYSGIDIDTDNYLLFVLKMQLFQYNLRYSKLREVVKKDDWTTLPSPIIVNAMYSPDQNSIYLPAGILQGVFFNADRPRYMNYGALGFVIGHEITHGFDDIGRQFDKDGNLNDWWAEKTKKAFLKRTKCIIDQYGKLTVPELNKTLNGVYTQGENIADNGGIKLAYSAYQAWVEKNGPEEVLPGLNYTQNQMFWISAASSWCSKTRTQKLKLDVSEDTHAPAKFRVNVPFSNTQSFAEDFSCPEGSNMNPKKKCVIW